MNRCTFFGTGAIVASVLAAAPAAAQNIDITFENMMPSGGTAFTPVFFGLSDGSFDLFNPGGLASAGLEALAEVGQTGTLTAEFNAADPTGQAATTATGPTLGGGSTTAGFTVTNPNQNRFLSFATMVVPTNDLFIGSSEGIEIFDNMGNFVGPFTINIFGSMVYDAGTEVNDADNGAAFLQGINGAAGTTEGGNINLFFGDPNASSYLASLLGRTTAPGFDIDSVFSESTLIARITVVPAPSTAAMLALAGVLTIRRRRA